ncbi:MAG: DctP family TRAP transporter solute-binding subunit, partial [Planctomycetes bacterium]|nr:DctP family TRAP transporter solute-binding subunit [Planctomycetota bacterium]
MRRFFVLAAVAVLALSLAARAGQEIRIGFTTDPGSPYWQGSSEFKRLLEEATNGELTVSIFPSAQLGSERDLIEGVALGTLEMCVCSTGALSNFSGDFMVLDLPYLGTSRDELFPVMDGPAGQAILATLEPKGIKAINFWENGFRNVMNNAKPIVHPEDLKGLKIRLMENPIHQATFTAFGALPVPMAWGEVLIALQQGTIDGNENALINILNDKIYEVQKHVSLTNHFFSPAVLMVNVDFFAMLSPDHQAAFLQAAE